MILKMTPQILWRNITISNLNFFFSIRSSQLWRNEDIYYYLLKEFASNLFSSTFQKGGMDCTIEQTAILKHFFS